MGYAAALIPPPEQPECPFNNDEKLKREWHAGYGDATDDCINLNGAWYD